MQETGKKDVIFEVALFLQVQDKQEGACSIRLETNQVGEDSPIQIQMTTA